MNVIQRLSERDRLSLEVVSSKKKGIRYRIVTDSSSVNTVKKQLSSYLPGFKFRLSKGVISCTEGLVVHSFRQTRHFAYPLKRQDQHDKSDPMSFIAGAMTQLEDDEEVSMQLVVRPYSSKKVSRVYNQILTTGRSNLDGKIKNLIISTTWAWVPGLLAGLLLENWATGILIALGLLVASLFIDKDEKPLTITEEKLYEDIIAKLDQQLLRTDIRFAVRSPRRSDQLVNDFISSLQPLSTQGYQSIQLSNNRLGKRGRMYLQKAYSNRLASVFERNCSILGAHELASLFHFPYGTIQTEDMVRSHSKTLPATLSLKDDPNLDIIFGVNKHHGIETPIGLTKDERERHMYVIGGTGSGKTTMLKYQIIQDIKNGKVSGYQYNQHLV